MTQDEQDKKFKIAFDSEMETINNNGNTGKVSIDWLRARKEDLDWLLIETRARLHAVNSEIQKRG